MLWVVQIAWSIMKPRKLVIPPENVCVQVCVHMHICIHVCTYVCSLIQLLTNQHHEIMLCTKKSALTLFLEGEI